MREIRGTVLSGGASRRMGSPKGNILLPWGLTMEANGQKILTGVTGVPAIVSGPGGIPDIRPDKGPMGGMESVLWRDDAEAWLFIPCDMPFLPGSLLARLVREFSRNNKRPAVVSCPALEPLLAVVPVSFREKITNAVDMEHLKVGRFWMECGFTSVSALDQGELQDVDHPWEVPA